MYLSNNIQIIICIILETNRTRCRRKQKKKSIFMHRNNRLKFHKCFYDSKLLLLIPYRVAP